jgi:hypothetical protein
MFHSHYNLKEIKPAKLHAKAEDDMKNNDADTKSGVKKIKN